MNALVLDRQDDPTLERSYPNVPVHRFRLQVCDLDTDARTQLAEFVCEPAELFAWFSTHRSALLDEEAPRTLPEGISLAQRIAEFYELVNSEDDVELDEVFAYRERHGLRFALRGIDVPDIYLGWHHSQHEISCAEAPAWSYQIDLPKFLAELPRS